jgi:hypothetical protein
MKRNLMILALAAACTGCSTNGDWEDQPVIPVSLKGIEAVNIDNSGEFPIVTATPVKKEAYMVGVRWIADNTPTEDDDIFITGPIKEGKGSYGTIADNYSKAVRCLTKFNANIPADTYVSKYFKEVDADYLPADVDEGFVLLVAPDPGIHSFRVEYYENSELKYSYETAPIEFF